MKNIINILPYFIIVLLMMLFLFTYNYCSKLEDQIIERDKLIQSILSNRN